jgi:hypothetical protein
MILTRDGKEVIAIYKQNGDEVDEVKDANGRLVYTNTREITGTLPLSFTSRGKPLSDYRISGNAVQDGTPTPEAPVEVVGCGARTENLFDITAFVQGIIPVKCTTNYDGTTNTLTIKTTGDDAHTGNANSYHVPVIGGETYTLSWDTSAGIGRVYIFENGLTDSSHIHDKNSAFRNMNVTMRSDTTFIIVRVGCDRANIVKTYSNIMLNLGSTALPYEPYGYKLPLTVNGTESPIYLGDAQTTRKIKKLVLTGKENWEKSSSTGAFYCSDAKFDATYLHRQLLTTVCSHYKTTNNDVNTGSLRDGELCLFASTPDTSLSTQEVYIKDNNIIDAAAFKIFLATQYTSGNPVTIWYVLAESETGIVNEPLMKIGNYADTITMAQAGETIPTVSGTNVLDMSSPVKPSEVYIKGKGIRAIT